MEFNNQNGMMTSSLKLFTGSGGRVPRVQSAASASGEWARVTHESIDMKHSSAIEELNKTGSAADIRRLRIHTLGFYPLPLETIRTYASVESLDVLAFVEDTTKILHLVGQLPSVSQVHFQHAAICDGNMTVKSETEYAGTMQQNKMVKWVTIQLSPDRYFQKPATKQQSINRRIFNILSYVGTLFTNLERVDLTIPPEIDLTSFRLRLPNVIVKWNPFVPTAPPVNQASGLGNGKRRHYNSRSSNETSYAAEASPELIVLEDDKEEDSTPTP